MKSYASRVLSIMAGAGSGVSALLAGAPAAAADAPPPPPENLRLVLDESGFVTPDGISARSNEVGMCFA